MATISSLGIGSGLDVNSLVTQLMAIERKPLDTMLAKQTTINSKISAMGTVKSLVSSLQTAALGLGVDLGAKFNNVKVLSSNPAFTALKGTVADTTVASATVGTTAASGSYALNVTQLAQSQILNTAQAPAVVAGTLSIAMAGGAAVPVTVGATDSLATIAANINANTTLNPTASPKVKASVIDNRLVLESVNTGAANTITVAATAGLEAFDTSTVTTPASVGPPAVSAVMAVTTARTALDATFSLNGISLTRSSNTVSDALTGVTLSLSKTSAGTPTTLTVGNDSAALLNAAQSFVTAFNSANSSMSSLSAYNPTTKTGSILNGDTSLGSVQSQLRRALTTTPASLKGGSYEQLSKLGIRTLADGSLSLDSTVLQTAFDANPSGVAAAMAAWGSGINTLATSQVSSTGLISGHISSFTKMVSDIDSQSITMQYRLDKTQARMKAQYSSLDTTVSSMNSTSSYLTQALASIAKNA
jgi:flagellar hook-associated protein 2